MINSLLDEEIMWRSFIDKIQHNIVKRDDTYKYYKLFNQSQYWDYSRLLNYQLELFNKLWDHSIKNVPYYKELANKLNLPSITSWKDIEIIPFLTKDIVRNNFYALKAENLPEERFGKNSTSGSSGSNFYFYSDRGARSVNESLTMRRFNWMGSSVFDKKFVIWGARWDIRNKSFLSSIKQRIKNTIVVSGYNLSDKDIINIYRQITREKPDIIKSYPSILYKISEVFNENNLSYKPKAIVIGGEKLHNFQREYIETTFNTKVFDYYSGRDMHAIAQNCDKFEGLHIFMENVIVEIIDEKGNPIEDGEGEIAVTSLHNYAMPFIRYRIGDRARITRNKKCSCGRQLLLLDEIIGRTFEVIEFPNGNRVGGSFWTLLLRSVPGIKNFQVVQEDYNLIQINYIPDNLSNEIDFSKIIARIKDYSGNKLYINFEKVDSLSANEAGKIQFIKSIITNWK